MLERRLSIILLIAGIIIISVGLIAGITEYDSQISKDYDRAEHVYKELPDNIYSEKRYLLAKDAYITNITLTTVYIITGVMGGLLFLAMGAIVGLLFKMNIYMKFCIDPVRSKPIAEQNQNL